MTSVRLAAWHGAGTLQTLRYGNVDRNSPRLMYSMHSENKAINKLVHWNKCVQLSAHFCEHFLLDLWQICALIWVFIRRSKQTRCSVIKEARLLPKARIIHRQAASSIARTKCGTKECCINTGYGEKCSSNGNGNMLQSNIHDVS